MLHQPRAWIRYVAPGRLLLIGAIALCWLMGNAPVCLDCSSGTVWLTLSDGTSLHARLHVPPGGGVNLPAVVVIPGYLGNVGFVETPWAADLTHLGSVALFLDRRGQGHSRGAWWPPPQNDTRHLRELTPDIAAAVAYLRSRAPLVDPTRVALLGHSDGGTGAIVAASADWELAATVALSASVAPWEYVNHLAPRNLLLLYGGEDQFILAETDRLLIRAATRSYLDGEGQLGSLLDGSARRLARVAGYGHVDLLYSSAARRAALEWLASALAIDGEVRLSPLRWPWVVAGLVLLALLVFVWNGVPAVRPVDEPWLARSSKVLAITALWTAGLWVASWAGPRLRSLPVQESHTVTSVLLGPGLFMSAVAIVLLLSRRSSGREAHTTRVSDLARGALAALVVQIAAEVLLRPVYAPALNAQRVGLFVVLLVLAAPAFAATCSAVNWVPNGRFARYVPVELLLALITGALAMPWFVRMSALPVLLLACVLVFVAAYRAGGGTTRSSALFGAILYARVASAVCAFY